MKFAPVLSAFAFVLFVATALPTALQAQTASPVGTLPGATTPSGTNTSSPGGGTTSTPSSSGGTGGGGGRGPCGGIQISPDKPLIFPVDNPLCLLQPLDDSTYILSPRGGIQIAFDYFNLSFPWLLGTAAGLAVLQGVVAGVQIMMGGSPDKVDAGKTRFIWALGGMIILGLSGVILRILNPTFYV